MPLSTEIFVMVIFLAGAPLFYFMLKGSELQGHRYFLLSYISLALSNICTVVEEFLLNSFFNACEHFFISIGAFLLLMAVIKLTKTTPKYGST